jgi:hypothetical protein
MSELCPTCKKPFHWRRKRLLSGKTSNTIGRPKVRNDDEIKKLRSLGYSLRQISHELKCSYGAVQRGLKAKGEL